MDIKNTLQLHATAKRDSAQQKSAESPTNFIYLQSVGQQLTVLSVLDIIENLVLEHTIITYNVADFNVKVEVTDVKKIIKLLKNDIALTFDGEKLIIKTGKKELKLLATTDNIQDNIAVVSEDLISADTTDILNYHNALKPCYRKDRDNLYQTHMLIDFDKKYVFATDSKQLKLFKNIKDIKFFKNEGRLILQSHVLDIIAKCHKDKLADKIVTVQLTQDNRIVINTGITRIFADRLTCTIPGVDNLINEPARGLTVDKKELVEVIKELVSVDTGVTLDIDDTVTLSVKTESINVSESIDVIAANNLEDFAIKFDGKLLIDGIKSFNEPTLKLGFNKNNYPILIRESNQYYVLMPMRM